MKSDEKTRFSNSLNDILFMVLLSVKLTDDLHPSKITLGHPGV